MEANERQIREGKGEVRERRSEKRRREEEDKKIGMAKLGQERGKRKVKSGKGKEEITAKERK
jgi:hypothetical protein